MRQTAQVLRTLRPGYVEIKVRRVSACASAHACGSSCDHCSMLENAPEIVVVAEDPQGAQAGDTVTVESATASVLGAAALLYIVPFLLFFAFYLSGSALGCSEGVAIALGGVGFILGLLCAWRLDRWRRDHRPVQFKVVSIED